MSFDDPTFQMCGFGSNQEPQGRRRGSGHLLYSGRKVTVKGIGAALSSQERSVNPHSNV